jgi:uncharacterized protein with von Willebrand factor type A (vWA) domain
MLTAIDGIIAELRKIGVPVSIAERIDAVASLPHLPLADRDLVKSALRAVLVKNHDHELAFDTLFDLYFAPTPGRRATRARPAKPTRRHRPVQRQRAWLGLRTGSGSLGSGSGSLGALDDAGLIDLLVLALGEGNDVLMRAIAGIFVDRHAGLEPGRPVAGTYYVFRTLRAVDPDRLIARLAGSGSGSEPGSEPVRTIRLWLCDALARRLQLESSQAQVNRFRQAVEAQVRQRLVADRGADAVARTLRRPLPEDVDFLTSSQEQIIAMRAVVDALARKLGGRLAEKRRHRRRGTLDFRRTVRASLGTGGVPIDPVFRKPNPSKPELFVLADISGSVATFAAFTLQLTFALRAQFSRVRSFVFVDGVDEVTEVLQRAPDIIEATRQINAAGSGVWLDGRSDYGHALESFWQQWGDQVRRRTTVIVLGDARTNYHNPAAGTLKAVRQRAGHVFWLNPEPRAAWNSGDSVIDSYQPFCDAVRECRNLRQLRAFVSELE